VKNLNKSISRPHWQLHWPRFLQKYLRYLIKLCQKRYLIKIIYPNQVKSIFLNMFYSFKSSWVKLEEFRVVSKLWERIQRGKLDFLHIFWEIIQEKIINYYSCSQFFTPYIIM
jgi:hypothetical protein